MSKKKSSSKEAFLPFFVGDFLAATYEWEGEAISLYATLLLHQWAGGTIPADPKRICKLVKWDWDLFQFHWRCVRRKFNPTTVENEDGDREDRLINHRLERHRDKTKELSLKNSASGAIGAQKRWGANGERHGGGMANAKKKDGERHTDEMANGTHIYSERHENGMALRHPQTDGAPDGNPSHPIPSHPDPSQKLLDISSHPESDQVGSAPDTREKSTRRKKKTNGHDPEPPEFAQLRELYPQRAGDQGWAEARRRCNARLKEGATWDEILAGAKRYAEYARATESENTQFVKTAAVFVGTEKHFLKPWSPPASKAQIRQDKNISAAQQWLAEQEAKDAKQ